MHFSQSQMHCAGSGGVKYISTTRGSHPILRHLAQPSVALRTLDPNSAISAAQTDHQRVCARLCRQWWRPAHQYNGRILLLLGLANTLIGIYVAQADNSWYIWVCIVWVAIILFGLGKSVYNRRSAATTPGRVSGSTTPARTVNADPKQPTSTNSIEIA